MEDGEYRASNAFWTAYSIPDLVNAEPEPPRDRLQQQEQRIRARYAELSAQYQLSEGDNDIPFSLTKISPPHKISAGGAFHRPYASSVAEHLKVDVAKALDTSHVVSEDAEDLRAELTRIAREWDDVPSGWSGNAASAFATLWEEWHDGAVKLVEILAETTRRLGHAAVAYEDQEEFRSGKSLRVPVEIEL